MRAERIRVRGQVQGVGFRPFVWRLAAAHGVAGQVLNDAEGVLIHAQGAALDAFAAALIAEAPPLARVTAVERAPTEARAGLTGFAIAASRGGAARARVAPDAALCPACAAEIADPADRRFRYPFANCTHCGPRFSIVRSVPYDRGSTTMSGFPMCAACRAEYEDPADRRFHAQPIACPACGPRAWAEVDGRAIAGEAVALAAALLQSGRIVAVKGLGGFHLACDAGDEAAVARLRVRKRRPAKPFALMAPNLAAIAAACAVCDAERAALASAEAPVVLLRRTAPGGIAPSVAPGQGALGWMLPATPLHRLLLDAVARPLVMTSGNLSGEPQVIDDAEARAKLSAFADAFLMHDRPIARRLDDGVGRVVGGRLHLLRRARGHAPATIALPEGLPDRPVLAYGGHLKAALCLTRDGEALLSHHLGDLDDAATAADYDRAKTDYADLFDHAPALLACDLHPDYRTTALAEARAARDGLPLVRVQHHHAHVAAAMAENGWRLADGPVLGVVMDGLGWGADGTVWGGEWLLADYAGFRRLARLKPVPLPGGPAAQREPWRMLLAHLDAAGLGAVADRLLPHKPRAALRAAVAKGVNAPLTSSAGRLFDAVAAAAGLAPDRLSYEGEAAMLLEGAADAAAEPLPFAIGETVDPAPMWRALLTGRDRGPGWIAAAFHAGLARAAADLARDLARAHGARAIALGGGCFQNGRLLTLTLDALAGDTVLVPALAPAGDGGLALGQATVAATRGVASV